MSGSKKLGRGLDTLIPRAIPTPIPVESLPPVLGTEGDVTDATTPAASDGAPGATIAWIDPKSVQANRDQPRERFDDDAIDELAHSIRENGILQPIVVRHGAGGGYELVAGERRLRASQRLELPQVPAIIRLVDDNQLLELALIENIQRENLNPIELAKAYSALRIQHNWTQEELADRLGKKRPSVANTLRLLELPPQVQKSIELGMLSAGHAKVLLSLAAEDQLSMHERVVNEGLSVRALEAALREPEPEVNTNADPRPAAAPGGSSSLKVKPPHVAEQEDLLSRALGTKVEIREGRGRGRIVIDYYSTDDYERLKNRMLGHA